MSPFQTSAGRSSTRASDGSEIERLAGFSRAARYGGLIAVSGTTANGPDGLVVHPGDTYAQTRTALTIGLEMIATLGGSRESVIRTRVMLTPDADWERASAAHRDLFGDVLPANSMFRVHSLIGEGYLVEVEIDAMATDPAEGRAAGQEAVG